MKPGVAPNFVSDLKPFHQSTLAVLEEEPSGSFSGVSKDGSYCWLVRGAQLEVLDMGTRNRLGAWHFGKVLGDQHTNVTCVSEYGRGHPRRLLVGVCNASSTGLLCMFNVSLSMITKAIEIPHPVTAIEVVCTESKGNMPRWSLSEQLRYFCGLVAVGTNSGHVYLVDMAMDDKEFFSDEELPSKVHFVCPRNRDVENQRFHCMSQGLHLCMTLNESLYTKQGFEYQKPDGIVMKTFQPERISISCLKYVPQTGLLVIGYNFGCFQLWKLSVPVLEYSSRLDFEAMPVTHVAYQEPENDPKNFCYLWVARGHGVTDEELECVSSICMYQLAFYHKSFYSNYGVFYDDLASICLRLSHELTPTPVQYGSNFEGTSRVVACYTLTDANYQPPITLGQDESYEEGSHSPDLSLCVFVWEVREQGSGSQAGQHLAVFDINRWYHAQMPSSIRYVSGSTDRCSYVSFCRLDEAVEKAEYENLLAVHVVADRLRKFVSTSVIPPEQHFYPASLAFDLKLVFDVGVVDAQFMGAQRQVLSNVERLGARALVQPQDLHNLCIYVGLLPQPADGVMHVVPNLVQQRESLLSLALDYNLVSFLKSCIVQWSGGEYEHQGCSLKFLIDWLWEKVSVTKHQIDTTCVNLYNMAGLPLDQRAVQTLQQCDRRLRHLIGLLQVFIQTGPMTEQGEADLQSKVVVTSLLSQHLNVVMWFVGADLLPEREDVESYSGCQFCYPSHGLTMAYNKRRTELQQIHSELQDGDLLMIDGLVEFLGVRDLWEREGGSGQYPPPSLHALLSSYLLENVDSLSKHCLVLYLLLDLVSLDNADQNDEFSEKVLRFAQRFSVPHTLVKCVQAFWLLDHRDFEEALVLILDPLVLCEFSRWQHRRIIRALLYQGDAKMALRYITSARPALNTPEEVKLKLTVLLANGMTAEALEYQRVCRDQNNSTDLLTHLFLGCQQTKTVDRLLQLPLTTEEESILVQYLIDSSEPHSQELLVMHYLQRARFIEAIQLNEKLKHTIMMDANPKARERAAARNAIVDSFAKLLPTVQRKLMFEQAHIPRKSTVQHSVCAKPTPLSTKITQNKANVMSRSAFIFTIIEKLDEIETEEEPANETMNKSLGPFICTPITPARRSLRDTPATSYPEPTDETGTVLSKSVFAFQDGNTPKGMDKRQSRFFSASCLSLLQTPTVKPLRPKTPSKSSAHAITPQSILKIRSFTSKMSPSPHSSTTTPTSQELESSARKLPRKLGYGTASKTATPTAKDTPLSSLPRHLAPEMPSLPSSPRASSQPTTPKSVSFADTTFSRASSMKTLSTPVKGRSPGRSPVRFMEPERSPPSVPVEPDSEETESPLPQSLQSSEGLQRRPLRTSPPKATEREEENISDDDVEEMDTSGRSPTLRLSISPGTKDSPAGSPETTPPASPQKSPRKPGSPTVKISKSPVSAYSPQARETLSEEQVSSAAEEADVIDKPETIDIDLTVDDEMDVDADGMEVGEEQDQKPETSTHEIFEDDEEITPATELVEEDGVEVATVSSSDDEMPTQSARQEVEVEAQSVKQEVEEIIAPSEPVRQQMPSSSSEHRSEEEWKELQRKALTPISKRPIKLITPESSPGSDADISPSTKKEQIRKQIDEKFADSPELPQVGTSTEIKVVQTRTRVRKTFDLKPVKVELNESPERTQEKEPETDTAVSSVLDTDSVKPSSEVVEPVYKDDLESVEENVAATEPESEHVQDMIDTDNEPEEPATPSRGRRAHQTAAADDVVAPATPTRSSRRLQKKEEEEASDVQVQVKTPPRSSRKKVVKEEAPEQLVEISADSPRMFSQSAREVVQESLLQISEQMKAENETSPSNMTKLKSKDVESRTPTRRTRRSETPTREVLKQSDEIAEHSETSEAENVQVSRSSLSPVKETNKSNNAETLAPELKSPARSTRNHRASPARRSVEHSDITLSQTKRTPTRSRRKKDSVSAADDIDDIGAQTVLPVEDKTEMDITTLGTSGRPSFERSEIPEDYAEDSVETTPSRRRRSLARSCKNDQDQVPPLPHTPTRRQSLANSDKLSLPGTPTRRKSLAHSAKLFNEEGKIADAIGAMDTAQIQPALPRTPTRRGRAKIGTELEEIGEHEPLVVTPSRSRSRKSDKDDKENVKSETEPSTPSRRGRSRKSDISEADVKLALENEPLTPSRRGRSRSVSMDADVETVPKPSTPSRRGRPKKVEKESETETETESKPSTPSRRGRPKKTVTKDTGVVKSETDEEEVAVTPSRRGRGRKSKTSESEGKPVTPSRRGRGKKQDVAEPVEMEETTEEEQQVTTPSRRGRGRKVDTEKQVEDEQLKLTPSRSKRRKQEKESPASAEEVEGKGRDTSPRVSNNELFDIQRTSFMFSGPQMLDDSRGPTTPVKSFTPTKSFMFSPPISTHTRSRSSEEKGILLPPGETEASMKEEVKKAAKKPAKKSRSRKLYTESEKVLLISPVGQGKDDSGSEGLAIVTRSSRAGSKKMETQKDGTQLLLKSMNLGRRPARTSVRFGPVGKKTKAAEK